MTEKEKLNGMLKTERKLTQEEKLEEKENKL